MSDGDELLDKANALLAKYRESADFPVLTEVVEPHAEPLPASPLQIPVTATSPTNGALDTELRALEENLRRDILLRLQAELEAFLAEPLELRIRAQLEGAAAQLTTDVISAVRTSISDLARQAVAEAIQRELAALRDRLNPH